MPAKASDNATSGEPVPNAAMPGSGSPGAAMADGAGQDSAPASETEAADLAAIRVQIDSIDSALCDLIRQRTALSRQVAVAKKAEGNSRPVRPAREAQIIRSMIGKLGGEVPVVSVTRIWRELIAGAIEAHQGGLTVLIGGDATVWDLSREHFGSAPKLEYCPEMPVILRRLRENERTLVVMPAPSDDDPSPWWAQMLDVDGPQPRICARLPFITPDSPRLARAGALAVAAGVEPEPSGEDKTMLIVEYDRDYSRASVADGLRQAGWTVRDLISWRVPESGPLNRVLVELDDFIAVDDPRLEGVREAARGHIRRIVHFGGYPVPVAGGAIPASGARGGARGRSPGGGDG
ncbi:MAG: chorismate mutase [Alphaproteobacteria bacterium]